MALEVRVEPLMKAVEGRLANPRPSSVLKDWVIHAPAALDHASRQNVAFYFNKVFESQLGTTQAGVLITSDVFLEVVQAQAPHVWSQGLVISVPHPYWAMAVVSEWFAPLLNRQSHLEGATSKQVHSSAVISPGVVLPSKIEVGPNVVIEEGVTLAEGVILYPGVYLGRGVTVGKNSVLFAGVKVYDQCIIGDNVRVHAGAVLGADGFGYVPKLVNGLPQGHQKIHHFGTVRVGDRVEIGANVCIDRGTFTDTVIGADCKIDNLVQLGHNVQLGDGTIVCGQAGLAGSSKTGRYVMIGGAAGLDNQVQVNDFAKVAAMTLVTKDVPAGKTVIGNPQRESGEHWRIQVLLNQMLKKRRTRESS